MHRLDATLRREPYFLHFSNVIPTLKKTVRYCSNNDDDKRERDVVCIVVAVVLLVAGWTKKNQIQVEKMLVQAEKKEKHKKLLSKYSSHLVNHRSFLGGNILPCNFLKNELSSFFSSCVHCVS